MYWPIGTPKIYATTTAHTSSNYNVVVSHDGLLAQGEKDDSASSSSLESPRELEAEAEPATETKPHDDEAVVDLSPTPAFKSVENDTSEHYFAASDRYRLPTDEPIVALKVSRTGHLFAVITASTLTIWQTKVCTHHSSGRPGRSGTCSFADLHYPYLAHRCPRSRCPIRSFQEDIRSQRRPPHDTRLGYVSCAD